jgi:predicted transcriptional regulator
MSAHAVSVRISPTASARLTAIALSTGKSKVAILEEALAAMEDKAFWDSMNKGYTAHGAALRAPLEATDNSLLDGLNGVAG